MVSFNVVVGIGIGTVIGLGVFSVHKIIEK